jgi:hypothetical protein
MSDTQRDQDALLWTAKPRAARVPRPGETVWRLRHADGRVQTCELRNHAEAGGAWEVQLFQGGELLFGHETGSGARWLDRGRGRRDGRRVMWLFEMGPRMVRLGIVLVGLLLAFIAGRLVFRK